MATKKKRLGAQLRAESYVQSSWGNKVRAPKASDNGGAVAEGGRWESAKSAKQNTVSTRARYKTAVSNANKSVRK